jgi:3',5'-cyclic AMP phosphodiesterase CpdA
MIRIAHLSDLHVLSRTGTAWRSILFTKRITGYANLLLRRGRVHRREFLETVLDAVTKDVDHCVVTGDIVNLALDSEYDEAKSLLDGVARSVEVTVVPGNHDTYVPPIFHQRRFPHYFGHFLDGDLPALASDLPVGPYPCVKLRGPVAIIALSTGVPRPPFVASGYVGAEQLSAFAAVLAHPDVASRTPVILVHHPPVDGRSWLTQRRDGLVDGAGLRRLLAPLSRGLVLFGHLHARVRCRLRTAAGSLDVIGASGAALDHDDPSIRAGYNRYVIDDQGGIATIEAHVLDRWGRTCERTPIAERPECT